MQKIINEEAYKERIKTLEAELAKEKVARAAVESANAVGSTSKAGKEKEPTGVPSSEAGPATKATSAERDKKYASRYYF